MLKIKLKNTVFIVFGAMIFSFGVININIENNLAEGGFTGITLILYNLFSIDPGLSNLVLNIPLFIVGWRLLGLQTLLYTIIGTVSVSLFMWVFHYQIQTPFPLHDDLTLAALFAGAFIGIGLGIIFRFGGTTGGVDIVARLVNKYVGWTIGRTMFLFDACVITAAALTYLNYKEAMYTLVAVFVGARVIDFIQEGAYAAKAAMIISEHNETIAKTIIEEMDRGATILDGKGSFTGARKEVLYCVISRNEIFRLRNLIQRIDPHAFVAVNDVHDVLGEGFTLDENKNPLTD